MTATARILLVDDDETISCTLLEALRIQGYEDVTWVPDGLQAVETYPTLLPDLVIMDITMPVMDGYEASCRIKAFDPNALIVVLTGNPGDIRARRILVEGVAEQVVQKPIRLIELRDIIDRHVSGTASGGPCATACQSANQRPACGSTL